MPKFVSQKFIEENFAKTLAGTFKDPQMQKLFMIMTALVVGFTLLGTAAGNWFSKLSSKEDKKLTKKLREIIGNEKIVVRAVKSSDVNAYTYGSKELYYTTGLQRRLTEGQLIAVMLHEYGHYEKKHVLKGMAYTAGTNTMGTALVMAMLTLVGAGGVGVVLNFIGSVVAGMAFFTPGLLMDLFHASKNMTIGRHHEYVADSYAHKYGYGKEMLGALKKLDTYMLTKLCGGRKNKDTKGCRFKVWFAYLGDEHPVGENRIKKVAKQVEQESKKPNLIKRVMEKF